MSDIDVVKENVQFEQLVNEGNSNCVLKDEFLIPDTHPDVQEILTVKAKPVITNKEIMGDKIVQEGKVEYTVLYLAQEEELVINSVSYTQKFTSSIDIKEDEHSVICEAECSVEHIEVSIMNERKILIQGIFDIDWELYKTNEFEFVKEVEGSQDVQVLKDVEQINKINAKKDLELTGKSMIRVGMDKPQVASILNCSCMLHKKEVKVLEGKIYASCYCKVSILYKGDTENDIVAIDDDVYLSTEADAPEVTSDMFPSITFEVPDNDLLLEEDDLGEVRIINNEFKVNASVKVFSKEEIEAVKDAYSPKSNLALKTDKCTVGIMHGAANTETIVKDNLQLNEDDSKPEQIIYANADLIITNKEVKEDKIIVEGIVNADVLYKTSDEEKGVADVQGEIPFSTSIDISGINDNMKAVIKAAVEKVEAAVEGNSIAIKANINLTGKALYETEKEFVSDIVEEEGSKPEKKASIIIYVVGDGDTLWKLAKKYNSTVEDLAKINSIEDANVLKTGQKLIIPGRAVFAK